ncbi:PREDICTED: complement component C8 beta chain [Dipodomys ordii]|uniref:Complement component C8 beta chain n=1 Tax=Dipodomys ordii TaxID=10020 RepID=A0A1S3FNR3_DIPOR|nr:PREDICTED: complement component C8 beta chain [Dipodomys ordii]
MKRGMWVWRALAEVFLLSAFLVCLSLPGSRGQIPHSLESNTVNGSLARSRQVRSVDVAPMPVDCELSSWSSWTACDPCQKKRYRHTYLLRPSQFNGEPCNYSDKEVEDCVTSSPCRSQVRCEGFVCAHTGRCINRRLLCNGDNDCGDQSDEANCKRIYKKCQREMDQYWAIGTLASGINLFTNSLEGPVLDHRYYAGGCSPHYILNTRFRKPYNVDSYTPQTQGKNEFTFMEYESYSDFEHNVTKHVTSKSSFSFGLKIPKIFEFGIDEASNAGKHYISRIKRFSHTVNRNKRKTMIEDLVVLVRGGASEHITTLAYKELPTAELMQEWGDAVQYNPAIIKVKAEPLYELVTATDFAYSSTVRQNMKRALEEFQREASACLCAPCQGNGVPVLKGSRCDCICPVGFQGLACELTYRTDVPIDGQWNCWSDWTPCSGGRKTRQRQCTNPSPQNGGRPCSGPASEILDC